MDLPKRLLVCKAAPHGEYCGEGWSGHITEREALLDWITDAGITGAVFLSGDLHQVGMFELRPGMVEITASPLDASGQVMNHASGEVERTVFSQHGYNQAFAMLTIPADSDNGDLATPQLRVEIYQGGSTVVLELIHTALMVLGALLLLTAAPLCHLAHPSGLNFVDMCRRATQVSLCNNLTVHVHVGVAPRL